MTREQSQKANQYIKEAYNKAISVAEIAKHTNLDPKSVIKRARRMGLSHPNKNGILSWQSCSFKEADVKKTVKQLTDEARLEGKLRQADVQRQHDSRKYKAVVDDNTKLQAALDNALLLKKYKPIIHHIKPLEPGKKGEATAVALLSDVHGEEVVLPHKVNGLNEYNPAISDRRVSRFHELVMRFLKVDRHETRIDNLLLWWGGDFFTNDMHGAPTAMGPAPAVQRAIDQLVSGLKYLLEQDKTLKIHIVGSVGNHSRAQTQKPVNQATEQENSWEWLMYHTIRALFRDEKRITWTLDNSYHSYVQVYDKTVRFNHGHLGWRYNMGLGGVHGSLWKVISQTWDKQRKADLTVCGHYHTLTPASMGRPYMVNGSIIGVTPYGMQFGFEPPAQMYFLIHNKYGIVNQRALFVDE
jgi:hypothetical protein